MSTKKGIGYIDLTDRVFIGRQNRKKRMWIGEKEDITNQFLDVASYYFSENSIRTVESESTSSLFIHIRNDKKSIEKLIKNLKELL